MEQVRADWKKEFLDSLVIKKRSRFFLSTALLYMFLQWMFTEGLYANDALTSHKEQVPINVIDQYSLLTCVSTYITEWLFLAPHLLIMYHTENVEMLLDHAFISLLFSFRAIVFAMKYFYFSHYVSAYNFECYLSFVHMFGVIAAIYILRKDEDQELSLINKPSASRPVPLN